MYIFSFPFKIDILLLDTTTNYIVLNNINYTATNKWIRLSNYFEKKSVKLKKKNKPA